MVYQIKTLSLLKKQNNNIKKIEIMAFQDRLLKKTIEFKETMLNKKIEENGILYDIVFIEKKENITIGDNHMVKVPELKVEWDLSSFMIGVNEGLIKLV